MITTAILHILHTRSNRQTVAQSSAVLLLCYCLSVVPITLHYYCITELGLPILPAECSDANWLSFPTTALYSSVVLRVTILPAQQ